MSRALVLCLFFGLVFSIGEIQEVGDFNNDFFQELAEFATSKLYQNLTNEMMPKVEVLKVREQIVSGINFFLSLEITLADNTIHRCDATVYVEPWKDTRELLKSDCPTPAHLKFGEGDGDAGPVDPDDPVVQRVAKYAVEHINKLSTCFKEARLEFVDKALTSRSYYNVDMTICNWPFVSHDDEIRIPHPCALPENLYECNAVVLTANEQPVSFEGYSCTGC